MSNSKNLKHCLSPPTDLNSGPSTPKKGKLEYDLSTCSIPTPMFALISTSNEKSLNQQVHDNANKLAEFIAVQCMTKVHKNACGDVHTTDFFHWFIDTPPPALEGYLVHKNMKDRASCFFMVGIVVHSQLITPTDRESYQITIIPPDFNWDCIIFNITTGLGLGDKKRVLLKTFLSDNRIPVRPGTPVFVTFTVSSYKWSVDKGTALSPSKSPGKMKDNGFKDVLSLNLQEVVVLQDMVIDSGESDDETAENDTGDVFV
ncbi:hypothetical protein K439DRAFT_1559686 [Ramaria rubella]|nr:hypothetical protein K439DRAFT_1559686 [Ramaria rubella]